MHRNFFLAVALRFFTRHGGPQKPPPRRRISQTTPFYSHTEIHRRGGEFHPLPAFGIIPSRT